MTIAGEPLHRMEDVRSSTSASDGLPTFEAFYRGEVDGQVRRAAILIGSSDQANDVVHDAFVEIFRRWDVLEQPGAYLNRAVLNKCRDVGRRRKRQQQLVSRLIVPDDAHPDHAPIGDLLADLPFNQRAAIVLRFYAGLGNAEIAAALDCPVGSVGPWISRGLQQLRKAFP